MPIYEYECKDCGHQFEAIRKIIDGPPSACPSCGKDALVKRVSKVAFRLKGTGWYETDFKNKGGDKKSDAGSGDGASAGDKGTKESTTDKSAKETKESSSSESKTASGSGESKKVAAKSDD